MSTVQVLAASHALATVLDYIPDTMQQNSFVVSAKYFVTVTRKVANILPLRNMVTLSREIAQSVKCLDLEGPTLRDPASIQKVMDDSAHL